MPTSLADILAAARQMATALTANAEDLAGRGANAAFVANGEGLITQLAAADAEQERLKAQLKVTTAQVETLRKQLTDWHSEASGTVKLAYRAQPQKWIEFGIKAKK